MKSTTLWMRYQFQVSWESRQPDLVRAGFVQCGLKRNQGIAPCSEAKTESRRAFGHKLMFLANFEKRFDMKSTSLRMGYQFQVSRETRQPGLVRAVLVKCGLKRNPGIPPCSEA